MNLVTLENIGKQFSERVLLEGASLLINQGDRIGLIGINGSGKTTLLRMIAGLDRPDAGQITIWGGVRIQFLPQNPAMDGHLTVLEHLFQSEHPQLRLLRDYRLAAEQLQRQPHNQALQERLLHLTGEMERTHSWNADNKIKTILTQLGITEFDAPVGTLSGGQQKRVALAHALIDPADLLILDEPTNHIDADTIAWLEGYLTTVPGALLMVTHDRYFLDRVANRIVELDRRQLVNYPGNYSAYLAARTARHEQLAAQEVKRQALLRQELEWLRRGVMARGTKQKARKQRITELQQLSYDRGDRRVAMALASRRLGKRVLKAQGIHMAYGPHTVLDGVDFDLAPGDRVGIIGPNGVGKSTLLDILAGQTRPGRGSIEWGETVQLGYYDQHGDVMPDTQRVIAFIEAEAPLIRTDSEERVDAAQMLDWFLFTRPEQQTRIGSLSGGERRRLYLLRTLVHQPNVLLLDEPTNDLDIQTLTVLEEFLDHFKGVLVVASHDRYFLDRTVDFLVTIEDGQVSGRYPAPFENYQRIRAEQRVAQAAPAAAETPRPGKTTPAPRKRSWKEQQELNQLETAIAALERDKGQLTQAINQAGSDYTSVQTLADQLANLEARLDEALLRWLELSER